MFSTLRSQKGLAPIIIILIVVGIVAISGGVYWWQKSAPKENVPAPTFTAPTAPTSPTSIPTPTAPTPSPTPTPKPDETSNWKIYQSERLGFEIKYPENWVSEEKYKHINQVGFYPIGTPPLYSGGTEILPLIDFHEIDPQRVEYDLHSQMEKNKYKLGNIEIIKFIPTTRDSKLAAIVYLNNDKIYEVWVDYEARETFNKMLPTLKKIR